LNASTSREIDAAFANLYVVPMTSAVREITDAGGLMSYGAGLSDVFRQVGVYAALILKGTKRAGFPVLQSSKFDLVINLPTARTLGIEVPNAFLLAADEVIE